MKLWIGLVAILIPILFQSACTVPVKPEGRDSAILSPYEAVPLTEPVEIAKELNELANEETQATLASEVEKKKASNVIKTKSEDLEAQVEKGVEKNAGKNRDSIRETKGRRPAGGKVTLIRHRVRSGDTLMKIAFLYLGDLTRWREVYEDNHPKIANPNSLAKGMVLEVKVYDVVRVSKKGEAYRIKSGDTLVRISSWAYGTFKKWKLLWNNNRELIHDPHWIYSGFNLYLAKRSPKRRPERRPERVVAEVVQTISGEPVPLPENPSLDGK